MIAVSCGENAYHDCMLSTHLNLVGKGSYWKQHQSKRGLLQLKFQLQIIGKAFSYQLYQTNCIPTLPFSYVILVLMTNSLVINGKIQDELLIEFIGEQDEQLSSLLKSSLRALLLCPVQLTSSYLVNRCSKMVESSLLSTNSSKVT